MNYDVFGKMKPNKCQEVFIASIFVRKYVLVKVKIEKSCQVLCKLIENKKKFLNILACIPG